MLKDKQIAFIGGGQMSQAIFCGLIDAGVAQAENILVLDIDKARLGFLEAEYGVKTALNDDENITACKLAGCCDIILLAVKPQFSMGILQNIATSIAASSVVISIMGGVTLQTLEISLPNIPILRVMPNTAMQVGKGCAAIASGKLAKQQHINICSAIFNAVGSSILLNENLINAFTSVGGCGPAFAYLFIEALADGAVQQGLPRQLALETAAQMLAGAAEMVLKTGLHPAQLKDNVCSAGGGSIAGVKALEAGAFRGIVMDAVESSCKRMNELGK